jgi:hypothetical protein
MNATKAELLEEIKAANMELRGEFVKLLTEIKKDIQNICNTSKEFEIWRSTMEKRARYAHERYLQAFYSSFSLPPMYPYEYCPIRAQELSMLTTEEIKRLSEQKINESEEENTEQTTILPVPQQLGQSELEVQGWQFSASEFQQANVDEMPDHGSFCVTKSSLSLPGGCRAAAQTAFDFFGSYHSMMNVRKIEDAIMLHDDDDGCGTPLTFAATGTTTVNGLNPEMKEVISDMDYFVWEENTAIWTKGRSKISSDIGQKGPLHTVILVHTAEGNVIVVDWSYRQFLAAELKNVRLYHGSFSPISIKLVSR